MVPTIRIIILFLALAVAVAGAAQEEHIFVNGAVHPKVERDGSEGAPFRTITEALQLARTIRFGCPSAHIPPSTHPINMHVARGTYTGVFRADHAALLETLPIVLNVPNLRLNGALRFDANGKVLLKTKTVLRPLTRQLEKQHMLVVTRTTATIDCGIPASFERAGDFVTISGFFFEGVPREGTAPDSTNARGSALVSVDGVMDVLVSKNVFTHAGAFGMTARLSSGRIENNQFIGNGAVGLNITGGSERFPATIQVVGNRMMGNGTFPTSAIPHGLGGGVSLQGAAQTTEGDRDGLFDPYPFRRVPLPRFYDRTQDPAGVPDTLDASLVRNHIGGNAAFGIQVHGYIRDIYELDPADPAAPMTANVTARLIDNVSKGNGNYGIVVIAGQIKIDKVRKHIINTRVSFQENAFVGNVSGAALFGFWRFASSVLADEVNDSTFKFAHDSTITICGYEGQFSFENRKIDPIGQTPTNNALTVNNEKLMAKTCVPLEGCVFQVPASSPDCT
jgi:hypothetical protein